MASKIIVEINDIETVFFLLLYNVFNELEMNIDSINIDQLT